MTDFRRILGLAAALVLLAGAAAARPILVGFYLPWDAASRASVLQHAGALDVLAPMSGALDSPSGSIRWQADPARAAAPAGRGKPAKTPKVFPIVSNAHDNIWDAAAADGALLDPQAGAAFIGALVDQARAQGYGGYILDFETLSPSAAAAYPAFLARLRLALKPLGRELWVTAGLAADPALVRQLADATDAVVLMAYDQCWVNSTPGPIAGQGWLQAALDAKLGAPGADPGHFVVALGAYGYDWPQGRPAAVISAPDAAQLARGAGQTVARELPAANPHFAYAASDGQAHAVWYLDAQAFKAQRAAVEARRVRGVAVWRLGLEDPAIWSKAVPPQVTAPPPAAPRPPCVALPAAR
ncbi:MAG: glycosyl hydrolase family 18 protein [Caulobacterales bacterium]|jgi:spore germination protein YaaH